MPFVVGWIIASIATPVVNWLEKRLKIRKKLGSALIIIGVLALMGTLGYFAVSWLVSEVSSLIKDFPEMYVQLEKGLHQIGISMSGIFSKLPDGIQNGWTTTVANLDDTMGNLMSKISEPTVSAAGNIAKRVPSYLVSTIVAVMSSYFFISEREEVVTWVKQIAPKSVTERMIMVIDNLKYAVGGYFKAQLRIDGNCIFDFGCRTWIFESSLLCIVCIFDRISRFPTIFWNRNCDDSMGYICSLYGRL